MIIPGLTDVDLSDMANMTLEQLQDLEHLANERAKEFQMQLEAIHLMGGVSKEQANQFKDILPKQVALESFTGQITHTNYDVACEALSTAVKVVGAIGLAAAVGAIGFLIAKMMNGGKNTPKNDAVERVNKAAAGLDEFDGSAEYKAHREDLAKRKELLVKLLTEANLSNCAVTLFDGMDAKPPMLVRNASTLAIRADELSKNLDHLVGPMLREAEKVGQGEDNTKLLEKINHFVKHHGGGRSNKDAVGTILGLVKDDGHFDPASPKTIADMTKYLLGKFPEYPMADFQTIQGIRADFKKSQIKIDGAKKDLEGNTKLSKEANAALRDGFNDLSERMKDLDTALVYIDREIEEYNRAGAVFGKYVGQAFEAVRESLMGSDMTPEEKAENIQKLDAAYRK